MNVSLLGSNVQNSWLNICMYVLEDLYNNIEFKYWDVMKKKQVELLTFEQVVPRIYRLPVLCHFRWFGLIVVLSCPVVF